MSTEAQRVDDSPSTSGGSSDGDQRESVQQEPEREQVQPKKKEGKISSKTAAKLSTSAKRYLNYYMPFRKVLVSIYCFKFYLCVVFSHFSGVWSMRFRDFSFLFKILLQCFNCRQYELFNI